MSPKPLALVVGGNRGIGKSTTLRLADSGSDICLTYHRNEKAANSVRFKIESKGVACRPVTFDVADGEQTEAALTPLWMSVRLRSSCLTPGSSAIGCWL